MRHLCAVVAITLACSTGCYHSAGPDGSGADAGVAKCPFGPALAYDPHVAYPFCQYENPDGWERYCPSSEPDGWGYMNWHSDGDGNGTLCHDDGSCNTCLCFKSCYLGTPPGESPDGGPVTTACPAPETGTAVATCVANATGPMRGTCVLYCDGGEQCPDGMRCVQDPAGDTGWAASGRRICAWDVGDDRCSL